MATCCGKLSRRILERRAAAAQKITKCAKGRSVRRRVKFYRTQAPLAIQTCMPKPRNPRHFDTIGGGRREKCVRQVYCQTSIEGTQPLFGTLFGVPPVSVLSSDNGLRD